MPHPYYGVVTFDTNKVAERDQMPAKSPKEAEDLLPYWMSKIKYRLVKLSWFPEECKITTLKWLHKKGSRDRSLELQTYFCFAFSIQNFWEIKIFSVKRLKKNGLLCIYRRRSRAISCFSYILEISSNHYQKVALYVDDTRISFRDEYIQKAEDVL